MTGMKGLEQAVYLARSGKSRELRLAALRLDGCPEGGWPETRQAWRDIESWLPLRSERTYRPRTAPRRNHGRRYRAKIWLEVDDEGFVCTATGTWDEIAARVPTDWLERAKAVRAGIVAARSAVEER